MTGSLCVGKRKRNALLRPLLIQTCLWGRLQGTGLFD